MTKTFYIIVILLFIGFNIDTVLSEFQIFRIDRALSVCQIKRENFTTVESSGSLFDGSTEMCNIWEEAKSCVFVAKHQKWNGTVDDYQEHGCGVCPVNSNLICNIVKDSDGGRNTVCCCKTPNCLTNIYRDSEVGWKGRDSGASCIKANYDSLRNPRWIENQGISTRNSFESTLTCYLTMRSSTFTDTRNSQNRSRLMMEMGYGCPFQMISSQPQLSISNDRIHHCCQGPLCNQELYRMIGFEWIQNTITKEEEQEFFRRLRFEKESYRYKNFVRNTNYFYPKYLFDAFHTQLVILVLMLSVAIVLFCVPKNIDTLPPVKHRIKEEKNPTELRSDDALVFGEL